MYEFFNQYTAPLNTTDLTDISPETIEEVTRSLRGSSGGLSNGEMTAILCVSIVIAMVACRYYCTRICGDTYARDTAPQTQNRL